MKKRYPLEPLVTLRRERAERRVRELGEAERRALAEKAALDDARAQREAAAARARAEAERERAHLEAGLARAHDLTRAERHRVLVAQRVEALRTAERRAEKSSDAAEQAVSRARAALGSARAEARVVERHEEHFRKAGELEALAAEDEAAQDFHTGLSRRRKG
jgi:hypothetical protein